MRNAVQLCLAANNILHMRKGNRAFLLLAIALAWKWQIASLPEDIHWKNKLGNRMIKQLLNSVIAKYLDLSVSRRSIICLSLRLGQIIDLLATDKSRYFAQPRPLIVNCFHFSFSLFFLQTSYLLSQKWKQFSWAIRKTCLLCWGLLVTQSATQTSERVKRDADAFVKYSWLSWRELQQTLIYASTYWTDKTRFDSEETKLATYSSSSFNKVCLGTRFENQDTFFVINKTADSMLSVIAGNVFHPISVGRNTWRKLFGDKGLLEPHCNTEGFNPVCFPILVRIGILFNDFSPCTQCGSWIAFGAGPSGCQLFAPPTATANDFACYGV